LRAARQIGLGLTTAVVLSLAGLAALPTSVLASDSSGSRSLPWAANTSWYFNGPHNWGDSSGPWNSWDLNGNGGTSVFPVLAATAGTVRVVKADV
jgi:hypothetical protein